MAKLPQRYLYLCCVVPLVLLLATVGVFLREMQCAQDTSVLILNKLCAAYMKRDVDGNLCGSLCDGISFQYDRCANYDGGKVTLLGQLENQTIVLKSKHPYMSDYDPVYYSTDAYFNLPSYKEFRSMISETLQFNLNINSLDDNIVNNMWTTDILDKMDNSKSKMAAMQSLWSLVQQDEYVIVKYFAGSKYVPHIYGTCGHVYAMEYSPPGSLLNPGFLQITQMDDPPWKERLMIALFLLELVRYMDEHFHERLNICDVKGANFGLTPQGVLKVIDWDMVVFDSRLHQLFSGFNCTHTSDCSFFDCYSSCDTTTNRCIPERINTNMQTICQHILLDSSSNTYRGLLRKPPEEIQTNLKKLLSNCAALSLYHHEPANQIVEAKNLNEAIYSLLSQHFYDNFFNAESREVLPKDAL